MRNVIIGTAGHVDHGKTALVRALTGTDTDRLEEEKRRGITIDLGFAHLELPDGSKAGIVDVPGHERFIRNMLSGAGGIDLALLVIAADEGVMPQTREHLGILQLLGIRRGCVALTKTDLVEADWLELVTEEVREELAGTFLADAEILPVSALTGQGIDQLRNTLFSLVDQMPDKDIKKPFRLPVDPVFTMQGFGTVVTGTLIEGSLSEGEEVTIYPAGESFRVRSVQVHAAKVETAFAGQRVAVNLHKAKQEDVPRGSVLASPGSIKSSMMLDAAIRVLPDAQRILTNGCRLHFHHGSGELLCKLVLLGGREQLLPGEEAYGQLRFEEQVAAKAGDPFILRFYSPLETVGGGTVLDPQPYKHRPSSQKAMDRLHSMHEGDGGQRLETLLLGHGHRFVNVNALALQAALPGEEVASVLEELAQGQQVVKLREDLFIHRDNLAAALQKAQEALADYHQRHPLRGGMRREELRKACFPGQAEEDADLALDALVAKGDLALSGKAFAMPGFEITLSAKQQALHDEVIKRFQSAGFSPPEKAALQAEYANEKEFTRVQEYLLDKGDLVTVSPEISFLRADLGEALERFTRLHADKGAVSLADFRDALNTSRKYALSILEYWDRRGITRMSGDARVLAR